MRIDRFRHILIERQDVILVQDRMVRKLRVGLAHNAADHLCQCRMGRCSMARSNDYLLLYVDFGGMSLSSRVHSVPSTQTRTLNIH